MSQLAAHFTVGYLSIFNGQHQIVGCPTKMLTDGFSIISNDCYFHGYSLFNREVPATRFFMLISGIEN
ncbi:MAG: hypothetical protein ACD_34C00062G0002 [uncultured bacterium]|nr:MAG: hypothetical protein ACD_34C00062G0002 [uncultured bacterium]